MPGKELLESVARVVLASQGHLEKEREIAAAALARTRAAADALRALGSDVEPIKNALEFLDGVSGYFDYSVTVHWGESIPTRKDGQGRPTTTLRVKLNLATWLVAHGFPAHRARKLLGLSGERWIKRPATCEPHWAEVFDALAAHPEQHVELIELGPK